MVESFIAYVGFTFFYGFAFFLYHTLMIFLLQAAFQGIKLYQRQEALKIRDLRLRIYVIYFAVK